MYHLVVLDNVPEARAAMEGVVAESPFGPLFDVTSVASEKALCDLVDAGRGPDVLLTDIRLDDHGPTGIDIVQRLFPEGCATQVIYVTGYVEYCTDVYETAHMYFLTKPVKQKEIDRALARAVRNLEARSLETLMVKFGRESAALPTQDIVFIESRRRKLEIHALCGVYETYGTVAAMLDRLPGEFVRCHKSFIVNLNQVARLNGSEFVLKTGEVVPISQRCRQKARERFFQHLSR